MQRQASLLERFGNSQAEMCFMQFQVSTTETTAGMCIKCAINIPILTRRTLLCVLFIIYMIVALVFFCIETGISDFVFRHLCQSPSQNNQIYFYCGTGPTIGVHKNLRNEQQIVSFMVPHDERFM